MRAVTSIARSLLFTAFALGAAGCVGAAPTAPEGFVLTVQLSGIRASVIENVRIVLVPQVDVTGMPRFAAIEPYDAGGIQVSVDTMGRMTLTVSGDYIRANGVPAGVGDLDPRFDIEVWSDDVMMRAGPQILGYVVIGGAQLGMAAAYLLEWPLPLGEGVILAIACTVGFESQCAPPMP